MTESTKPAQTRQDVKADEPKKKADAALDDKQLDKVTGGSIALACATGKHIPKGTIST
ncbi:MAG TPA: hypothetical protein VHA35_22435 [Dongiaceae bacterium]|nr:hypothetical protein [Dongiaceae bacterium]